MCLRVHVAFSVLQERRKRMKRVGMSVFFHNFAGKSVYFVRQIVYCRSANRLFHSTNNHYYYGKT